MCIFTLFETFPKYSSEGGDDDEKSPKVHFQSGKSIVTGYSQIDLIASCAKQN